MSYEVLIIRRAQKDLYLLHQEIYKRIKMAIWSLREDPRPNGCKKLIGREGWRIRVGDYRVIYEIDEKSKTVTVLHIGHRHGIYK